MKLIAGSEYLSLDLLSVSDKNSANEKWLSTHLKIKLDNLEAWKEVSFYDNELEGFIQKLIELKNSKIEYIFFSNMEDDITFSISIDSKGYIFFDGILSFGRNNLNFKLITDRSALDNFINEVLFELKNY